MYKKISALFTVMLIVTVYCIVALAASVKPTTSAKPTVTAKPSQPKTSVKPSTSSSSKATGSPLITPKPEDVVDLEVTSDVKTDMVFNYAPMGEDSNLFIVLSKENNYTYKGKNTVGVFSIQAAGGYALIPEYAKNMDEISYPNDIILEKGKSKSIKITKVKKGETPKQKEVDKIEVTYDDKAKAKPKYGFLNYVIYGIFGVAAVVVFIKLKLRGR